MIRRNLLAQIGIAFLVAVLLGLFFPDFTFVVEPLGELFLRLIKFIIVPLILSTLIVGVGNAGDVTKLGRMGGKTLAFYLLTTLVASIIGLVFAYLIKPGVGFNLNNVSTEAVEPNEPQSFIQTLLNIVPTNPIDALANTSVLQIIFFALFIGIGIILVGEKGKPVYNFFDSLSQIMFKITGIVMAISPLGVLGLVAPVVASHGSEVLLPLLKVLLAMIIACLVHVVIVYSLIIKFTKKISLKRFFKGIIPAGTVAFSTCSSSGTLPITMNNSINNHGVSKTTASFVLPLGATINMDGAAIYQGIAVVFVAQIYDVNLSFAQLLIVVLTATLASIGSAGIPGAGLVVLSMVLSSVNLPLEGIALVAGIDRILDMFRTSVNVIGDASAAIVVDEKK